MKYINNEEKLELLLSRDIIQEKYNFRRTPFVLFGAGNLCIRTIDILDKLKIKPLAIGDNNEKKIGTNIKGIPILDIKEIIKIYGKSILVIVSIWKADYNKNFRVANIIQNLNTQGFDNVVDITKLYNQYPNDFFPHYCIDSPYKILNQKEKILEAYKLFKEEKSKKEYYNQMIWRLFHNNWHEFVEVDSPLYFQDDIYMIKNDDIIFDCGAYDGDTIKQIIEKTNYCFNKIIAFEPDQENYDKIKNYISNNNKKLMDKVEVFKYAIGDTQGLLSFKANSDAGSMVSDDGNCKVESISIDSFVKKIKYFVPTIIKMDIEGFEVNALTGAKNIIKEHNPILIISVYHKQDDLWEIPLLIKSYNKNYLFFLRHHTGDCWDTVLYALPKQRFNNYKTF